MIKTIHIVGFLLCMSHGIFAQEIIFPSDKNIRVYDLNPMYSGDDVIGYFALLFRGLNPQKDKDNNEWNLIIMDINFKITRDLSIYVDKDFGRRNVGFDGTHFFFAFTDEKNEIRYVFYDLDGKRTGAYSIEGLPALKLLSRYSLFEKALVVPNSGILRDGINPKNAQLIQFIDNAGNVVWNRPPQKVSKGGKDTNVEEELQVYHSDEKYTILGIYKPKFSIDDLREQSNTSFEVLSTKSGKQLFSVSCRHKEGWLQPSVFISGDNTIIEFGYLFGFQGNEVERDGDDDLGIYTRTFDLNGNLLQERIYNWRTDVDSVVNWRRYFPGIDRADLWIHKAIHCRDKYYVVGEVYKMDVMLDFVILEFSSDLQLQDCHRFEKRDSGMPAFGIQTADNYKLGSWFKSSGMMSYVYSAVNPDQTMFNIVFSNKMDSAVRPQRSLDAIALNRDGELVRPVILIDKSTDQLRIVPAKIGYAAIIETDIRDGFSRLFLHKLDY